jgi:hypothetical protein
VPPMSVVGVAPRASASSANQPPPSARGCRLTFDANQPAPPYGLLVILCRSADVGRAPVWLARAERPG